MIIVNLLSEIFILNLFFTRIHSIPVYIPYHFIPGHIPYQGTFHTRIHFIPGFIPYQDIFHTRIHSIPGYVPYQDTHTRIHFIESELVPKILSSLLKMNTVFYLYVNSTSIKLWSYHELLAYKKCTIILLSLYRFSNGGTKSVLHTDSYENLHCLASGIKEFVLIEPKYINTIGPEHGIKGYYDLDVERYWDISH